LTARIILDFGEADAITIKKHIPCHNPGDFPSPLAKVYKFVEQHQHSALQKFSLFWASLTARQRKALRRCYMRPDAMSVAKRSPPRFTPARIRSRWEVWRRLRSLSAFIS